MPDFPLSYSLQSRLRESVSYVDVLTRTVLTSLHAFALVSLRNEHAGSIHSDKLFCLVGYRSIPFCLVGYRVRVKNDDNYCIVFIIYSFYKAYHF